MNKFAKNLNELISVKCDGDQRKFAKLVGCAPSAISQYLYEDRRPMCDKIISICKACHVSADWLLGLKEGTIEEASTH